MQVPTIHRVIHNAINDEFERAFRKHNGRTPRSWAVDDGEALAILMEEVGEVARALTSGSPNDVNDQDKLYKELIQVATMAAAWAERIGVQGDPIITGRSFEIDSGHVTTEVVDITSLERKAA